MLIWPRSTLISWGKHSIRLCRKNLPIRVGWQAQIGPVLSVSCTVVFLKRPPKTPDRAYPLVKNQEYAYAYDWEHRPG